MSYKKESLVFANSSSENLLIDAKQLHNMLKVNTRFTEWIQRRIIEFKFIEGEDFYYSQNWEVKPNQNVTGQYASRKDDYQLTLDMAKELAMLERNETGRKVRRYFIAVEKEARAAAATAKMLPKSIHSTEMNGRRMYPFLKLAYKLGYKPGGSLYGKRKCYPNHFVTFNKLVYCTEEFGSLLAMQRTVTRHRATVKEMQPVLPFNFGQQLLPMKGGML